MTNLEKAEYAIGSIKTLDDMLDLMSDAAEGKVDIRSPNNAGSFFLAEVSRLAFEQLKSKVSP